MTAAEKYAALEAACEAVPKCDCHGEPRQWVRDRRSTGGGYWRGCTVRHRERARMRLRKHYEVNREAVRARQAAWYHDPANSMTVLKRLQAKQVRYHAKRLEDLSAQVSP